MNVIVKDGQKIDLSKQVQFKNIGIFRVNYVEVDNCNESNIALIQEYVNCKY